jgi:pimeloyl-ACP methyl ester carboxylesterase
VSRVASRSFIALGLVAALVLGACGGDDGESADVPEITTTPRPDSTDAFGWTAFGEDGVETGSLEVPVDPDDPSKGTFDLYVARHLADPDRRIGSLLVNPGGPGVAGADFAIFADQIFSPTLLDHFDVIGFDPRGVGLSEPAIDCVDDYDRFYANVDISPDDDAERDVMVELTEEFEQGCLQRAGEIIPYVGTNFAAGDMDAIRQALGEETISYLGFSYGSELGAVWATRFPDTVRAAVLDGAVDPTADSRESTLQQVAGFERTLGQFFAWCADTDDCAFRGDARDADGVAAAFDALMVTLDESPVPTDAGRPPADLGMANNAVATALYSSSFWPELGTALANAAEGDGAGLLALHDQYFGRLPDGTWENTLEAFQVITCADDPERQTPEEALTQLEELRDVAPRMVPATFTLPACAGLPLAPQGRVEITGDGAGTIVVVGTTGDSATPIEGTRTMADTLEDGRLIVVEADQHTGYGANDCVTDLVDTYLIELAAPADETTCD